MGQYLCYPTASCTKKSKYMHQTRIRRLILCLIILKIQITGHLNIQGRAIRQLRNLIILGNCRASCVLVSRDIYPKLLRPCYTFCICRTSPCATDLLFHFQCSRNLLYKHREFDINQQKLTSKPSVLSSSII